MYAYGGMKKTTRYRPSEDQLKSTTAHFRCANQDQSLRSRMSSCVGTWILTLNVNAVEAATTYQRESTLGFQRLVQQYCKVHRREISTKLTEPVPVHMSLYKAGLDNILNITSHQYQRSHQSTPSCNVIDLPSRIEKSLCLDPRNVKNNILREHYYCRAIEIFHNSTAINTSLWLIPRVFACRNGWRIKLAYAPSTHHLVEKDHPATIWRVCRKSCSKRSYTTRVKAYRAWWASLIKPYQTTLPKNAMKHSYPWCMIRKGWNKVP